MARIVPKRELWQYQPDARVMRAPPRKRGTTANDVLAWTRALAAGAELVGPIAGKLFSGKKSTPSIGPTQGELDAGEAARRTFNKTVRPKREAEYAKALAESGTTGAAMGADHLALTPADQDNARSYKGVTDAMAAEAERKGRQAYFRRHGRDQGSDALLADAQAAALSGDRTLAMEVAKRLKHADFGDVTAGGFGDLLTGAHKDRRRAQILKILRSGRFPVAPHESILRQREQQIAASKAQTAIRGQKEKRAQALHPHELKSAKTKAEVDVATKDASVSKAYSEADLKRLQALKRSKEYKALPRKIQLELANKFWDIRNKQSQIWTRRKKHKLSESKFRHQKTQDALKAIPVPSSLKNLANDMRTAGNVQASTEAESDALRNPPFAGSYVQLPDGSYRPAPMDKATHFAPPDDQGNPDLTRVYPKPGYKKAAKRREQSRKIGAASKGAEAKLARAKEKAIRELYRLGVSDELVEKVRADRLDPVDAYIEHIKNMRKSAPSDSGGGKRESTTVTTRSYTR